MEHSRAKPTLNLTYDDGPDPLWTIRVLERLARADAAATFFMVGERVDSAPEVVSEVLDAGCMIELHCHRHIRHTELSERQIEDDVREGLSALARVGVKPLRWRTPWGVQTTATVSVAARHGLELTGWSLDTHDWRGDTGELIATRLRDRLVDGGVVLMHDAIGPGAQRVECDNTLQATDLLIGRARELGLTIACLSAGEVAARGSASPTAPQHSPELLA